MTGPAPARRLLVHLIDEQAIETEPLAEIRTDLAALGVDPARSIALSRRLAAQANGPAVALLRRISESETDDDEIRRLETADVGAVRRSLPEAITAATTARARRAAGGDSNVVGLRRRRSRRLLYGLSGIAAAMAASLVLYVGLSTDQPFRLEQAREAPEAAVASRPGAPAAEPGRDDSGLNLLEGQPLPQPPAAEADAARTESSDVLQPQFSGGGIQAANEPAAPGTQSVAQAPTTFGGDEEGGATHRFRRDEQAVVDAAELQSQNGERLARLQAELAQQSSQPADAAAGAATASAPPAVPPLPRPAVTIIPERKPDLVAGATGSMTTATASEQTGPQSLAVDAAAAPTAPPPFGLIHPVVALLIVDPRLAPPGVRQEDFSVGTLPARLGEARRLAEGRTVVALVTLRMADRAVDAIISESSGSKSLSRAAAVREKESTTLGPVAPGYELIELDRR
jgi:hypothetical protein